MGEITGIGNRRWVPAPNIYNPLRSVSGEITGVWLEDGETVEFHKLIMPDGSVIVTGYTITKKPVELNNLRI